MNLVRVDSSDTYNVHTHTHTHIHTHTHTHTLSSVSGVLGWLCVSCVCLGGLQGVVFMRAASQQIDTQHDSTTSAWPGRASLTHTHTQANRDVVTYTRKTDTRTPNTHTHTHVGAHTNTHTFPLSLHTGVLSRSMKTMGWI